MKTKEELNAIKEEVENVNKKIAELTDEELAEVIGGEGVGQGGIGTVTTMSPGTQDVETFIGKFKTPYSRNTDENV